MLYFVGDIHGNLEGLNKALQKVKFSKEEDTLICTGDLVDRGLDNMEVLELLDEPWFSSVRGNHDQFLVDANTSRLTKYIHACNGGAWFYSLSRQEQIEAAEYAETLPYALKVTYKGYTFGVVHAEVPFNFTVWDEFETSIEEENLTTIDKALWGRDAIRSSNEAPHVDGVSYLVHGHTGVSSITQVGQRVWLDTQHAGDISVISAERIIASSLLKGEYA